jgi:hypothetical protein
MNKWNIALFWAAQLGTTVHAQELSPKTGQLEVFWSRQVSVTGTQTDTGPVVASVITDSNGKLFALVKRGRTPLIWSWLNQSGPGQELTLKISGYGTKIAVGPDGSISLAGEKSYRISNFKMQFRPRGYLARFDLSGKNLLEKVYDNLPNQYVWSVASLPAGDLLMVARNDDPVNRMYPIWLRKIAPDGGVIWERRIAFSSSNGGQLDSIIAPLSDGTIAVVTPEADNEGENYREHLVLLLFANDGAPIQRMRIREALHITRPTIIAPETVAMVTKGNDIYVMSNAHEFLGRQGFSIRQIEVTKIAAASGISWTTVLPSDGAEDALPCEASLAKKPNGGLLVGCAYKNEINLYDLNEQTGQAVRTKIALPECHRKGVTRVFVLPGPDGQVDLIGTLRRNANGESCTWYGRVSESLR